MDKITSEQIIQEMCELNDSFFGHSNRIINSRKISDAFEYVSKLKEFGFKENILVSEHEKNSSQISEIYYMLKNSTYEILKNKFFPLKLITFGSMLRICQKYELYTGMASFYKEHIPIDNLEEIEKFIKNSKNKYPGIFLKDNFFAEETSNPIIHMTAPLKAFNVDVPGRFIVGNSILEDMTVEKSYIFKELKKKPIVLDDPIAWIPVKIKIIGEGCLIITKWGPEAILPEFINEIEN